MELNTTLQEKQKNGRIGEPKEYQRLSLPIQSPDMKPTYYLAAILDKYLRKRKTNKQTHTNVLSRAHTNIIYQLETKVLSEFGAETVEEDLSIIPIY